MAVVLWDATVGTTAAIKEEGKEAKKTTKDLKDLADETTHTIQVTERFTDQMDDAIGKSRAYKLAMVQLREEFALFIAMNENALIPSYVKLAEHNEIARQALLGMGVAGLQLSNILGIELPKAMEPPIDSMGKLADMAERSFGQLRGAAEQAITAAILSGESIPKAMRKAVAGAIAALAGQAIVEALMQTAFGFAALARNDFRGASMHFKSAAIFGAVGIAAAIAGRALAPSGTSASTITNPDGSPGGIILSSGSTNATTVRGLQSGGLVTRPTLALLGEGGIPELVTPLNARSGGDSGSLVEGPTNGTIPLQINVEGLISQDTLIDFVRQLNEAVDGDVVFLKSSETSTLVERG